MNIDACAIINKNETIAQAGECIAECALQVTFGIIKACAFKKQMNCLMLKV